jgi:DNA-binding MarR family transcriptional regulator
MVKPRTTRPDAAPDELERDARDLLALMPRLVGGLKRAGRSAPEALRATRAGLGPRHLRALLHLGLDGEMSVGALARHLEVTLAAASLVAAELARAGVVERREDVADRRRTLVRVATDHEAWVRDLIEGWSDPMRRFLAALGPDERRAFLRQLGMLADEMAAPAGPREDGA